MSKYAYSPEMGEISGFGGSYEEACRKMVMAGIEWWDSHPTADVRYKEFKGVFGLTTGESDDCKEMQKTMLESIGNDCTGAMMQACTGHVMAIKRLGWKVYVKQMIENKDN